MLRARLALLGGALFVTACMDGAGPRPHPIEAALVGRYATWDMYGPRLEDAKAGGEFAPVPERQTWRADGTTTFWWRPVLVDWKVYPKPGLWRIEGRRTYCQSFELAPKAEDWRCYKFSVTDGGTRVHFDVIGRNWFIDLRVSYHGDLSDRPG